MNLNDEINLEYRKVLSRRHFFKECGVGLGSIALASLLNQNSIGAAQQLPANPLAPKKTPLTPRAKRVIYLFQAGAPSQLDLFDYKPGLVKYNGKPVPQELVSGNNFAFIKPDAGLYASEFKFARHGQSGAELSEAFMHLPKVADDIT